MQNTRQMISEIINKVQVLNPHFKATPAKDSEIAKIRTLLPQAPDILFELLKQCNGSDQECFFPNEMGLLSCEEIIDYHNHRQKTDNLYKGGFDFDDPIKPIPFNTKQFAFAGFDYKFYWLIDFDPSSTGTVGQIVYQDREPRVMQLVAPSLESLLSAYHADLQANQFVYSEDDNTIFLTSNKHNNWEVK